MTSEQEQARVEAKYISSPPKALTLWEILNSQLMLWILGSVVLSGITFYWNHRNDERAAVANSQREDSQFLGTMLPYLTSPDLNVRLRAVDIITARYPEGKMPDQISLLTVKVIGSVSTGSQSKQTEE